MAREAMVTRTIISTIANALCLNIETAEPFNQTVVLAGTYKDAKTLERAVKKAIENDTVKVATVVDSYEDEKLYGMTEVDFIKNAKVLPPRGTKQEQATDNTEENEAA